MRIKCLLRKGLSIFLAVSLALACVSYAAPISNYEVTLTQPDGTTLHCYASGDEFFNYYHDADGYLIMEDPATGYYVYATTDNDGKLIPSSNIVVHGDLVPGSRLFSDSTSISKKVTLEDVDFDANSHLTWSPPGEPGKGPGNAPNNSTASNGIGNVRPNPIEGVVENVVVLICFSDESPAISPNLANRIESVFNGSELSLKHYMNIVSGGVVELNSTLVGMSNSTVLMYQDSHPRSYYTRYPNNERETREQTLLKNAVDAINGSSLLAGKTLDVITPGEVDSITFIIRACSINPNGCAISTKS